MRQRLCLHPWAHDLAVAHLQHVTLIQTASGIIFATVKLSRKCPWDGNAQATMYRFLRTE